MRFQLLFFLFLVHLVIGQDVEIPGDLLKPKPKPSENVTSIESENSTSVKPGPPQNQTNVDEEHWGRWVDPDSGNVPDSGNLIGCSEINQYYPNLPPFGSSGCGNVIRPVTVQPMAPQPPTREEYKTCPIGFIQNGTQCVFKVSNDCPEGYEWKVDRCVLSTKICPLNFEYDGTNCVQRQICPHNHVWKDDRCVPPEPVCPTGWRWSNAKHSCEVAAIQCQPGSVLRGHECVIESFSCPIGYELRNNQCIKPQPFCPPGYELQASGHCSKVNLNCPPGSVLVGNECRNTAVSCPEGTYQVGNSCFLIPDRRPLPDIFPRPPIQPLPPRLDQTDENWVETNIPQPLPPSTNCPQGFVFQHNQCYRCPSGYNLCNRQCYRGSKPCQRNQQSNNGFNYPIPNININIKHTPSSSSGHSSGKGYNIINNVEPVNNTVINVNNVTHPIELNNRVENNIYIYTETQCADGSIRTTIIKNNETINGCIDIVDSDSKYNLTKNEIDGDYDYDDEPEKCCEVVTPRQCKKKGENQWICSHKRFKYCGKFCIADRLYLKPPATSINQNVLTIAPSHGNYKPCYGHSCPPVDCSGCVGGHSNCSPQCYTYPCQSTGCNYLDQKDFCDTVGGRICETD